MDKVVKKCDAQIREVFQSNLFDHFNKVVPAAAADAVQTASGWGAHRNEGGMYWATYKATCRGSRDGPVALSTGFVVFLTGPSSCKSPGTRMFMYWL